MLLYTHTSIWYINQTCTVASAPTMIRLGFYSNIHFIFGTVYGIDTMHDLLLFLNLIRGLVGKVSRGGQVREEVG